MYSDACLKKIERLCIFYQLICKRIALFALLYFDILILPVKQENLRLKVLYLGISTEVSWFAN